MQVEEVKKVEVDGVENFEIEIDENPVVEEAKVSEKVDFKVQPGFQKDIIIKASLKRDRELNESRQQLVMRQGSGFDIDKLVPNGL